MRVLIVEDDTNVSRLVRSHLERRDIVATAVGTVSEATFELAEHLFDVVILDLTLPDGSGFDILKSLRQNRPEVHVIILSGAGSERDRVRALDLGADDYVVKPFYARELAARVLAIHRRRVAAGTVIRAGSVEVNLGTREARIDDVAVDLTPEEFALLAFLAARRGHTFSRTELSYALRVAVPGRRREGSITRHVRGLRAKIEKDPRRPGLVRTVRGAGYRLGQTADDRNAETERQRIAGRGTVVHVSGEVVSADDAAAAIVGAAHGSDLVGKHMLDLVAPSSRDAAEARIRLTGSGSRPRSQVLELQKADGTAEEVEVSTHLSTWRGAPAVWVELVPATSGADRLRLLATGVKSEVSDAVIVTDTHLHIRSWNRAAARLYGWPEEEVLGRHILDVVEWVSDDRVLTDAWALLETTDHWHGEGRQLTRDGVISVRASTSVVRDENGERAGAVSVCRPADTDDHSVLVPAEGEVEDMRRGLRHQEFDVVYQSVVALADRSIISVEALVRWHHPGRGLLAPAAFMETAERSGLITDIGAVVLDKAINQAASWHNHGIDVHLAVNVSAAELADPLLADRIMGVASSAGFDLRSLWLEITETALVEDVERTASTLRRLADKGVGIAIDDFGTGWASLTYLQSFPIHVLKIDRSFVTNITESASDAAIARSIVNLGAELGLFVVAEGIETEPQSALLQQMGCTIGQGFLYGRPVPANELSLAMAPARRSHPLTTRTPAG